MLISKKEFSTLVKESSFRLLFNRLGWNNDKITQSIMINNYVYQIQSIAEKSGFRILLSMPNIEGKIPDYVTRRKIDIAVTKLFQEHLLIFVNDKKDEQLWQYIIKKQGNPSMVHEIRYNTTQAPELLYQKASGLFFALEEEDNVTIVDVNEKFNKNFNVNAEKVTKKFYDGFKKVHTEFVDFIEGIDEKLSKDWYASLMLNRLMFCYFIQKKGFLDNNKNYLRDKLAESQRSNCNNKFYSFYRFFLLELFHRGLGGIVRTPELVAEIGRIPYLNGGLFDIHEIEQKYVEINISDKAFEKIFDFFDQYEWHLDTSKDATGKEINPDVIGYIFEKYINDRAQMGAYYTQEDITEYISKNCILPYIFSETERKYPKAFQPEGFIWKLLKSSSNKYIHYPVKYGVDLPLPDNIKKGIDTQMPDLLERRKEWNKTATTDVSLNSETWREVYERRTRYFELKNKIHIGDILCIKDFITYNLDIRQFVQDIIETIDDVDFIWTFYKVMNDMTILDPTCGSGAFLFASLNILKPLYEGCIIRMRNYIDESGNARRYKNFEKVIDEIDQEIHPSQEYYVYKSIILKNLYGVDLMKEAVETAKLRLFLKLVAAVEADYKKENLGLEPLPDIDFNIKAGNTLVGYANEMELNDALNLRLDGMLLKGDIKEKCLLFERANHRYKAGQLEYGFDFSDFKEAKKELGIRQKELNNMLNKLYAGYDRIDFDKWINTSQPFHWYAEFYDIVVVKGGFDVIIGNPPYLEFKQVNYKIDGFISDSSKAVHAVCIERSTKLLGNHGCIGMIVPLSLVSTQRMKTVQKIIEQNRTTYYSNYSWRPGKLFDTVNRALTIFISINGNSEVYTTNYIKWSSINREFLLDRVCYTLLKVDDRDFWVPKFNSNIESQIIKKIRSEQSVLMNFFSKTEYKIFYRTTGGLYWKVFTDFSPMFKVNGVAGSSSREITLTVKNKEYVHSIIAILSSNLFWWWYTISSNLRDLNPADINNFPVFDEIVTSPEIRALGEKYVNDLQINSTMLQRVQKQTGITETQSFKIQNSKLIIDEIDKVLAKHYKITEEEVDFIINYDIKYRMGSDDNEE